MEAPAGDTQTITVNVAVIEVARIDSGLHGDFGGDHKADLSCCAESMVH